MAKKQRHRGEAGYDFAGIEDGILLPAYRLPTETEWEYAALGMEELRNANLYRGKKEISMAR